MAARLRDVAVRAGVSARSVSNVINGFQYVSPEMRAKVQTAVAELDYQPNLLARSLRRGRTGSVAFLLQEINVPYFGDLAHQLVQQAGDLGLSVFIDETSGLRQRELDLLDRRSRSGQVDGIILSALGVTSRDLAVLRPKVPVVLLGERATSPAFDHVGIDNVAAARLATSHLLDLGRRRVAVVAERHVPRAPASRLRLRGYRDAHVAHGVALDPALVARVEHPRRQDGVAAIRQLLDRPEPPDAVFCVNDLLAIGVLHELHLQGIRVPDDIGVVGFDDVEDCRFTAPALSSVTIDRVALAREALRLMNSRIDGSSEPRHYVQIPHQLAVRASSSPRPTAEL